MSPPHDPTATQCNRALTAMDCFAIRSAPFHASAPVEVLALIEAFAANQYNAHGLERVISDLVCEMTEEDGAPAQADAEDEWLRRNRHERTVWSEVVTFQVIDRAVEFLTGYDCAGQHTECEADSGEGQDYLQVDIAYAVAHAIAHHYHQLARPTVALVEAALGELAFWGGDAGADWSRDESVRDEATGDEARVLAVRAWGAMGNRERRHRAMAYRHDIGLWTPDWVLDAPLSDFGGEPYDQHEEFPFVTIPPCACRRCEVRADPAHFSLPYCFVTVRPAAVDPVPVPVPVPVRAQTAAADQACHALPHLRNLRQMLLPEMLGWS